MAQTSYSREERTRKPLEVTIADEERTVAERISAKHGVSKSIVVGAALVELAGADERRVAAAIEASAKRGGNRRQPAKKRRARGAS